MSPIYVISCYKPETPPESTICWFCSGGASRL